MVCSALQGLGHQLGRLEQLELAGLEERISNETSSLMSGAWAGLAVTVTCNASMWPFHVVGFSLHRERVLRNSISGRNSVPRDHPRRSQPSSFSPGNSDGLAQIPGRKHRLVLNGRHA